MPSLLLSNPRGLCAGVERALALVELALEAYPPPIYVRHEIVHNRYLVNSLQQRGVVFIEDIADVPTAAQVLIFSAHGVSTQVEREARQLNLKVIDSTCPLVTKVHVQVARIARAGEECVLIGHAGHPEVEGTLGRFDSTQGGAIYLVENVVQAQKLRVRNNKALHYVSQTTLSLDETASVVAVLKSRYPAIQSPRRDDICYATQNRQNAVKELCAKIDMLVVVGSDNSSNSRRLQEIGAEKGLPSLLLDDPATLHKQMFSGIERIGLTAGASAPPVLVNQVRDRIKQLSGAIEHESEGPREDITFGLPHEARHMQQLIAARELHT